MDVIELECPHCGDALELDAAFAGGVCRCSTCGTLMTVPADPSRERAETLTRRDRPDAPGSSSSRPDTPGGRAERPDVPGGPSKRPETPGGSTVISGDSSQADLAALASATPSEGEALRTAASTDDLYITASGKAVKFVEGGVPTARKRKKVIRYTVIGGFIALVLILVAIVFVAANLIFGNKGPKNTDDPKIVGVDPAVNPIKSSDANILSVPIGSEAAIVVDATSFAREFYPQMREIISHAVSLSATVDYMIIPWTDLNPKSFPGDKPAKIDRGKLGDLDDFLNVSNVGFTEPLPYVELALVGKSDQVIFITGRLLEESEVTALRDAVEKRVDTRFDVIIIGNHDEALQKLAKDNKGKYISIKNEQLQKWFDDWKKTP